MLNLRGDFPHPASGVLRQSLLLRHKGISQNGEYWLISTTEQFASAVRWMQVSFRSQKYYGRRRAYLAVVWDSKPDAPGAPINWVELKTSAEIRSDRDMDNFERKLLKFWIQSFLLGVRMSNHRLLAPLLVFCGQLGYLRAEQPCLGHSVAYCLPEKGVLT